MTPIAILILHDAVIASVVDPRTIFTGLNDFLAVAVKLTLFKGQPIELPRQLCHHLRLVMLLTADAKPCKKEPERLLFKAIFP
jgi:hypothetical protein